MRLASYIEQINRFAYLGATSAQPVSFLESAPQVPTLACKINVKCGSGNRPGSTYLGATFAEPASLLESASQLPMLACKMNVKYGSWNPAGIPADSRKSPGFSQVPHNFVRF